MSAGPEGRSRPTRLKRRADFVRAGKGTKFHGRTFSLQAMLRDGDTVRFGFTMIRHIGTATERNRIRRRFREAVRLGSDLPVQPGTDYVIVGRRLALSEPFENLLSDLRAAMLAVHAKAKRRKTG